MQMDCVITLAVAAAAWGLGVVFGRRMRSGGSAAGSTEESAPDRPDSSGAVVDVPAPAAKAPDAANGDDVEVGSAEPGAAEERAARS